ASRLARSHELTASYPWEEPTMRPTMILCAAAATASLATSAQAQPAQSPGTTFFVTSAGSGKGGDLGGIDGADTKCQELAQTIGAGGKTWRAYLSTTGAGGKTGSHAPAPIRQRP